MNGCTHVKCSCGAVIAKAYSQCDACRDKRERERYNAHPKKEWDGKSPLFSELLGEWFTDFDDAFDKEAANLPEGQELPWTDESCAKVCNDLMLILSEPTMPEPVHPEDLYADDLPEEGTIPGEVEDLFTTLNLKLKEVKTPLGYHYVNVADVVKVDKHETPKEV